MFPEVTVLSARGPWAAPSLWVAWSCSPPPQGHLQAVSSLSLDQVPPQHTVKVTGDCLPYVTGWPHEPPGGEDEPAQPTVQM